MRIDWTTKFYLFYNYFPFVYWKLHKTRIRDTCSWRTGDVLMTFLLNFVQKVNFGKIKNRRRPAVLYYWIEFLFVIQSIIEEKDQLFCFFFFTTTITTTTTAPTTRIAATMMTGRTQPLSPPAGGLVAGAEEEEEEEEESPPDAPRTVTEALGLMSSKISL